jgi:hypothetical protein
MNTKKFITIIAALFAAFVLAVILIKPPSIQPSAHVNTAGEVHSMKVYRSPDCGCCANWIAYMQAKAYEIEVINTDDVESVKSEYQIPKQLFACHTTIINDGQYFVEGHIPEEAIVQLMENEPDIKGIGMPGMPMASPGMPGTKMEPFDISQVHPDGSISNFMSL